MTVHLRFFFALKVVDLLTLTVGDMLRGLLLVPCTIHDYKIKLFVSTAFHRSHKFTP